MSAIVCYGLDDYFNEATRHWPPGMRAGFDAGYFGEGREDVRGRYAEEGFIMGQEQARIDATEASLDHEGPTEGSGDERQRVADVYNSWLP